MVREARAGMERMLPHLPEGAARDACKELITSFTKTLTGTQPGRSYQEELKGTALGYSMTDGGKIVLLHLRKLEQVIKEAGQVRTVNSSEKTVAKDNLRDTTPLKDYIGRLNLAPGKFDNIEVA